MCSCLQEDWFVGRQSIRVSDLFRCPRSIQLEYLRYSKDADKYEVVRGRWAHSLFERYLSGRDKATSIFDTETKYWLDTAYEDYMVKKKLREDLREIDRKIRLFFVTDKHGKHYNDNYSRIKTEQLMRIPLERFIPQIDMPQETLQKYCLSGKYDFALNSNIVELKTSKVLTKEQKTQAWVYKLMADLLYGVKHNVSYITLGDVKVKVERNPYLSLRAVLRGNYNLKDEVALLIKKAVENFEVIQENKRVLPVNRSGNCQFCSYYSSCLNVKNPRIGWRVINKPKVNSCNVVKDMCSKSCNCKNVQGTDTQVNVNRGE